MNELKYHGPLAKGDRGKRVRAAQEWLSLNGFGVVIDGQFGPATARAVRWFQEERGLTRSGRVDKKTFLALVDPLAVAVEPVVGAVDFGAAVVSHARQHLDAGAREVGGQNRGPWVRTYMGGKDGTPWPWCAGFVSFVLRQACEETGHRMPVKYTFSCDIMAEDAKRKGRFRKGSAISPADIRPGWLFLQRRTASDWVHVGIVTAAKSDYFHTLEGNTNDSGDREGYEVAARFRGFAKKDFIDTSFAE